jgi:hypothetical protein
MYPESLKKTVEFVGAQSKQPGCLMIGQAMGPATLSHQALQCCAGQFLTCTELARYLVGQLECDLHGNSLYYPITGLAPLSGIAVHTFPNLFTAAKKELAGRPTPHSLTRDSVVHNSHVNEIVSRLPSPRAFGSPASPFFAQLNIPRVKPARNHFGFLPNEAIFRLRPQPNGKWLPPAKNTSI